MIFKKNFRIIFVIVLLMGLGFYIKMGFTQDGNNKSSGKLVSIAPDTGKSVEPGNITLDFKDADIHSVFKVIAYKAGVNIVSGPEVAGTVTIKLADVPWRKALEVILKTQGLAYEEQANIIMIAPLEKMTEQKLKEAELSQIQPVQTEVFDLKFLDAQDAKKALEGQLSPRGRITVMQMTGQAGWEFGGVDTTKRSRTGDEVMGRSKILIVSDIQPKLQKIKEILQVVDVLPVQILIETRIVEVNHDKLKDIGFDFGTGSTGAESSIITTVPVNKSNGESQSVVGGNMLSSQVSPSVFGPKTSTISGVNPFNAGLEVVFQKLTGTQFQAILHAIEEDVQANVLSAPHILALNNQEASIIIGTKYPILKSEISTESAGQTVTSTLDYYQDIGIQLNVVPQVNKEGYINMIVHPAVTSKSGEVGDNKYPIIDTREAETRVIIKDNETIVIGGLIKNVKSEGVVGIPFLRHIPIFGFIFERKTNDFEKIDLLIFITAKIMKEKDFGRESIKQLESRVGVSSATKDKAIKEE
ncbi:MAG: secretin and TonB N-terminal domain-containing protein [Candidatus Gygaella obscura]|nr:secretin and TonB N-terminal domain-containing protein [Candidatus Gygaella obscura]